jgi:hypothetical protein
VRKLDGRNGEAEKGTPGRARLTGLASGSVATGHSPRTTGQLACGPFDRTTENATGSKLGLGRA